MNENQDSADIKEKLIDSIDDLIETTDSYKILTIRIILISSLTLIGCFMAILWNNQEKIVEKILANSATDEIVNRKVQTKLGVRDIIAIEWYLDKLSYPDNLVLGIESFNQVGFRDILWLSNSNLFFKRDSESSANLFSVLRSQIMFSKGECIDTGSIAQAEPYSYFACPVQKPTGEVIGSVWLNYDRNDYDKDKLAQNKLMLTKIITQIETINK